MQLLNKDTDYAIRAMMALVDKEDYISAKQMSEEQSIPYQFLRRILQKLIKHNLIESREGFGGGVKLIVDPVNLTVKNIIEFFQGPVTLSTCLFRNQICSNKENCVLRSEILRIESLVQNEFDNITIQSLVDKLK